MKLGTVVGACNLNPLYSEFVPIFIKSWKTLFPEIDVIVLLISESLPEYFTEYSEYIKLIPPIEGIHTAFHSQNIRLLYPQNIQKNEGVLITDIDMIPMNRFYYEDAIKNISDDTFISYRDCLLPDELPMCYNIAIPSVWKSIFENESLEKWYTRAEYDGNHGGLGWNIDQLVLIEKYNSYQGKKIILNDKITRYKRLDREGFNFNKLENNTLQIEVASGLYSDYHCLRPYSKYKEINDKIVSFLNNKSNNTLIKSPFFNFSRINIKNIFNQK